MHRCPPAIDFPVGTMFWARPEALAPLLRLGLNLDDYPDEPLPVDGTILHALERLLPLVRGRGISLRDGLPASVCSLNWK